MKITQKKTEEEGKKVINMLTQESYLNYGENLKEVTDKCMKSIRGKYSRDL